MGKHSQGQIDGFKAVFSFFTSSPLHEEPCDNENHIKEAFWAWKQMTSGAYWSYTAYIKVPFGTDSSEGVPIAAR